MLQINITGVTRSLFPWIDYLIHSLDTSKVRVDEVQITIWRISHRWDGISQPLKIILCTSCPSGISHASFWQEDQLVKTFEKNLCRWLMYCANNHDILFINNSSHYRVLKSLRLGKELPAASATQLRKKYGAVDRHLDLSSDYKVHQSIQPCEQYLWYQFFSSQNQTILQRTYRFLVLWGAASSYRVVQPGSILTWRCHYPVALYPIKACQNCAFSVLS